MRTREFFASLRIATMWSLLAAATVSPAAQSGVTIANPDRIIELPKFEVTDSRLLPQPEKWHYAEIPGFEVL